MQERERIFIEVLPILCQSSASVEPSEGSLDDPALGQNDEFLCGIGPLDDFDIDLAAYPLETCLELRALVAAICVELDEERKQSEHRAHQQHAAITILHVGCVYKSKQQQTLGIYGDMALLALDLLAGIIARRVNAGPPFSALLTLWLSIMATVGLASRPACSRHFT